jgi:hypothetical protein
MNKESLHYFIHSSEAINLEHTLKSLPSKKGRRGSEQKTRRIQKAQERDAEV